jgi:hypothetical protein
MTQHTSCGTIGFSGRPRASHLVELRTNGDGEGESTSYRFYETTTYVLSSQT